MSVNSACEDKMEHKKKDIRIIKTERAIKSSFLKLIEDNSISKVTVKDIIREAEINRSTFYAHYEDKYDLLYQIEQELLEKFDHVEVNMDLRHENMEEQFKILMESRAKLLKEHGRLIAQIIGKDGDPAFAEKLGDSIGDIWEQAHLEEKFIVPGNYIKAAVINTMSGLLGEWIHSGFKETPEEFAAIAVTVMGAFPRSLL